MRTKYYFLIFLIAAFACNKPVVDEHAGHDHGENAVSVTTWSDEYEVFAEFTEQDDHSKNALIHITRLENFKPLMDNDITLIIESANDEIIFKEKANLARPGIYSKPVHLLESGHLHASVQIKSDIITLGEFELHETDDHDEETDHSDDHPDHDHEAEEHEHSSDENDPEETEMNHINEPVGELIPFLKEQQWISEFNVEKVKTDNTKSVIYAIGKVLPHQQGLSEIVSPVEGFLNVNHNQNMVVPGSRVKAGQVLATLCPPIGRSNTWTERYLSYQRTEKNYERAQELKKRQAISNTEFEKVEQEYMVEKAGFETLFNAYNITPELDNNECMHFYIKAPINGIVSEMNIRPGQNIAAGDMMMTLVDPDVVWIKADLYEKEFYRLGKPEGATLELPGYNSKIHLKKNEIQMINKGEIVEEETRTIPVLFQLNNPQGMLKIGQTLQMNIYSSSDERAIVVPATSILDEDVQKFVFVQHSGEEFEKRLVKTGPVFEDWIAITDGLNPDERIVTKGTYLLKLATVTTAVGHAHNH